VGEDFFAALVGFSTQVVGGQEGHGKHGIGAHGVAPGGHFLTQPRDEARLAGGDVFRGGEVARVKLVDPGEVPSALDDLVIGFAACGPAFDDDEHFGDRGGLAEDFADRIGGIGGDPYAVLQVAEVIAVKRAAQALAQLKFPAGQIEEDQPPHAVPWAAPAFRRVAAAESETFAGFREADYATEVGLGVVFDEALPGQFRETAGEAAAPGPAFEGLTDVAPRRAKEALGSPEQEVEEFFVLGAHGERTGRDDGGGKMSQLRHVNVADRGVGWGG